MDVFEAVKSMLAIRDYEERAISNEIVSRILQAARLTGSSRNRQEWDFVVIRRPETLQQVGELARTGPYIGQAKLAIAVIVPDSPVGYIDGARATQDMMLVAWEAGIGSNWVANVNTEPLRSLLEIPDDKMLLNIIPFGYPATQIGGDVEKDRKPLAKIAHEERYGQPYEG